MVRFHRLEPSPAVWDELEGLQGQTTREWVDFVAATQKATPVLAELRDRSNRLGFFTGLTVKRLGLRILGSPFPGWMTPYMGFTLYPGVSRSLALAALERFAFYELGCVHIELLDRYITVEDAEQAGYAYTVAETYVTDLTQSEERLFATMKSACRRCIRKAAKSGVRVEEALGDASFVDEYYAQVTDGLLLKGLVPSFDIELVRGLIEHVSSTGRLLLLRARDAEGRCVGTGIFPVMNRTAHVWGNVASYTHSRHLRPIDALNWYAMRFWKARGVERFDWGGLGRHKEKYGGALVSVLRVRRSRYDLVARLRRAAETLLRRRLRMQGALMAAWTRRFGVAGF